LLDCLFIRGKRKVEFKQQPRRPLQLLSVFADNCKAMRIIMTGLLDEQRDGKLFLTGLLNYLQNQMSHLLYKLIFTDGLPMKNFHGKKRKRCTICGKR